MLCADLCPAQLHTELSLLEIIDNADLSTRISLRLRSQVDRLIRVHHPAELGDAKLALRGPFRGLLGEGSNSVFGAHIHGTLLQIAWRGIERLDRYQVRAQAGEHWDGRVGRPAVLAGGTPPSSVSSGISCTYSWLRLSQ